MSARATGEGQHLDVSLFEGVVTVLTTFFGLRGHWIHEPLGMAVALVILLSLTSLLQRLLLNRIREVPLSAG